MKELSFIAALACLVSSTNDISLGLCFLKVLDKTRHIVWVQEHEHLLIFEVHLFDANMTVLTCVDLDLSSFFNDSYHFSFLL